MCSLIVCSISLYCYVRIKRVYYNLIIFDKCRTSRDWVMHVKYYNLFIKIAIQQFIIFNDEWIQFACHKQTFNFGKL